MLRRAGSIPATGKGKGEVTMETVRPKDFSGYSMSPVAQLFGSGPKFKIRCGKCDLWFSKRIDFVDNPPAKCPYCDTVNLLPLIRN